MAFASSSQARIASPQFANRFTARLQIESGAWRGLRLLEQSPMRNCWFIHILSGKPDRHPALGARVPQRGGNAAADAGAAEQASCNVGSRKPSSQPRKRHPEYLELVFPSVCQAGVLLGIQPYGGFG